MDIRNPAMPDVDDEPGDTSIWFQNDEIGPDLREKLWSIISLEFEQILDRFYDRIENSSNRWMIEKLDRSLIKHKQINHWRQLVLYPVDADYETRLRTMHVLHLNIGMKHSFYISSYMYLLNAFQKEILRHSSGPREAYELIVAMNSIITDDMVRALDVEVNIIEL
ncbi:hypothetical protein GGD81_003893 [Rhodobium orientis]|uniref:Globin-sensor domain-containing protein n=1 Tax=Rhodobium orientis TaxID=34017 RepID=A0A327JNY6_9HYPH|nr:protoglobin domain-containing protein [Rhodobium orientis]MBB4304829.1 hypothetical protein [Rhodobium orientis]MBK5947999.1 hypothetical protein [Rhodobium orientis]RAI27435.1 hypothetical protein CH339_10100 [Rhodobium orientis]